MSNLLSTINERLSLKRHYRRIFERPLPKGVTYFYCLGGIAFFFLLILTFTGVVLSFYYVPSGHEAYSTLRFIDDKLPGGWLMRSMHVWAASGMVAAVLLHMIRVYLTGSYKPPREFNWVVGSTLFVLTMAFGFSGYLLPWDQKAYWATTVGTAMPRTIPVVGNFIMQLLRGGPDVTGITLLAVLRHARVHTAADFHIHFMGAFSHDSQARDIGGAIMEKNQKKFYPDYLFEILLVCLFVLEGTLVISYFFPPVTARPIDFSQNYTPLPEWYFLALYQMFKYFPGRLAFLGVAVIPAAVVFLVFALPFLEKTPSRRLRDRIPSALVAAFLLVSAAVLTVLSYF